MYFGITYTHECKCDIMIRGLTSPTNYSSLKAFAATVFDHGNQKPKAEIISSCLIKNHAIKTQKGLKVELHALLISALCGSQWTT
jgi:hypothetical protein